MTSLANLVVTLQAEISQYTAGLNAATAGIQKFSHDQQESLNQIKNGLVALGEAFSIREIFEFTKSVLDSNAALINFSASSGIAIDTLSQLEGAAKVQGIDDLDKGLTRLGKSITQAQEGSLSVQLAFRALGISTKDLNDANGNTYEILLKVADGFAKYADGAGKSGIAQQILGRGTTDLVHFLDQGSEGIKAFQSEIDELGGTVSGSLAANSKELTDNVTKLGIALKGVANEALAQILPDLIQFSANLDDAAKNAVKLGAFAQALVDSFRLLESGFTVAAAGYHTFKAVLGDIGGGAIDAIKAADPTKLFTGVGNAAKDTKQIVGDAVQDIKNDWNGYYKFLQDNNAAVAASQSSIASVRTASIEGAVALTDNLGRQLQDLQGDTLTGFKDSTNGLVAIGADAGKRTASAFSQAFAGLKDSTGSIQGLTSDLEGYDHVLTDVAKHTADLAAAAAGAADKPVLEPINEKSVEELKNFNDQLTQQVATFGKGSNAALEYSVTTGKIHDAITSLSNVTGDARGDIDGLVGSINKNISALRALGQAQDVKKIQEFIEGLRTQVATFDQGTLASIQYSVEHGKLAAQLALTGAQAKKFKDEILSAALAEESFKDHKAIEGINIQMLELTGNTEAAAKAAFDLQNAILKASLTNIVNTPIPTKGTAEDIAAAQAAHDRAVADLADLDIAKQRNDVQAEANGLLADLSRLQTSYDAQVQKVSDDVANYQTTTIDGQNQIAKLRTDEAAQIQVIIDKLNAIPGAAEQPGIVDSIIKTKAAVSGLNTQINALGNELRGDFVNAGTSAFSDFVTGAKSASDAVLSFLQDIEKALLDLVAKRYFEQLFGSSGSGGGLISGLAGLLGGSGGSSAGSAISTGLSASDTESLYGSIGGYLETGGPAAASSAHGGAPSVVGEVGAEMVVPDSGATPAASITAGGTRLPAEIPANAYMVGQRGPELHHFMTSGVVITHAKVMEGIPAAPPEKISTDDALAIAPTPPRIAQEKAADAIEPAPAPRAKDPEPLAPSRMVDRAAPEIRVTLPAIPAAPARPEPPFRAVPAPGEAPAVAAIASPAQPPVDTLEYSAVHPESTPPGAPPEPPAQPGPLSSAPETVQEPIAARGGPLVPEPVAVAPAASPKAAAPDIFAAPREATPPTAAVFAPAIVREIEAAALPIVAEPRALDASPVEIAQDEKQVDASPLALAPTVAQAEPVSYLETKLPSETARVATPVAFDPPAPRGEPIAPDVREFAPLAPAATIAAPDVREFEPAAPSAPAPIFPNVATPVVAGNLPAVAFDSGTAKATEPVAAGAALEARTVEKLAPTPIVAEPPIVEPAAFLPAIVEPIATRSEAVESSEKTRAMPDNSAASIFAAPADRSTAIVDVKLPAPSDKAPIPEAIFPEVAKAIEAADVIVHSTKVINNTTPVQTLLSSKEYEALLTDRYLEKRAYGGPVNAGQPYLVGEHGPELYVPHTSGQIMRNRQQGSGGVSMTNHFSISAPNGTVSKATQVQIAAATARGIQGASLRNN